MSLGVVNPSLYTNLVDGYTTTATAAGTTTLSYPASTRQQYFTGTTTQTLRLPVTTTFPANGLGIRYEVINNSTGVVTVQTGGSVTITTVAASTTVTFTCINVSTDATTSWSFTFPAAGSLSGDVTGTLSTTNVISVDGLPINATTGASSSIYFGYSSTVPTATTSIGIGYQAMNVATSATSKNVAVGVQALAALTLGQMGDGNNTAIGFQAMNRANADQTALSQSSTYNVAIGSYALNAPVLCNNNVMIGGNGSSFTRTTDSVAIGRGALTHFTSLYSTGTASQSGTTITGVGTTFTPDMIGSYILYSGGQAATISGYTSATVLTATSSQTVGSTTFQIYSGSSESTAVGRNALYVCNGNRNVGIGYLSGNSMTKSTYTTGTAGTGGVSSTTVTGSGTEWTSLMIGGLILFTGGAQGTITAVASTTSLTIGVAITVANGTAYTIYLSNGGNTLLGAVTAATLTTGQGNSIIGYGADCGADSINAIVIGNGAKSGVAAATDTIMIGRSAGNISATGDNNIGMGLRAFQSATSINRSVAIGAEALSTATTGNGAIAIGYQALKAYNGGSKNIAIGLWAGIGLTSGSNNIIMGYQTAQTMTLGGQNIIIGDFAAQNATLTSTNGYNTLIGISAGLSLGDAQHNNAIGLNALYSSSGTGTTNQAFGNFTLSAITTGSQNIAVGQCALYGLTTGTGNIGVGYTAFGAVSSGFGANASNGVYNVTGSSNIGIGNACASYSPGAIVYTTLAGSNNTIVGASAARYITYNAGTNTVVGSNAYRSGGGASNSVVIGSNALAGSLATGTIGQSTTTATASGATFTPEMVGGTIVYRTNVSSNGATGISSYTSSTSVTTTTSATFTSQAADIFYNTNASTAVGTNALNAAITGRNTAVGANALLVATAGRYTVGTASQSTTTVTGVGTNWFAEMVGATIVFSGGQVGLITAFNSVTSLTVTTSQTVASTTYTIYLSYNGNCAIGFNCGGGVTTGHYNTLMGYNAGATITTGYHNICIGFGADTSATVANSISIGRSASATVDNAVAIGTVTANVANGFFCQHRGPITVAYNVAGFIAGTNELVEITSSRRFKTNIRDLEEVSDKFDRLRPVRFNPKEGYGDVESEHIGLIAEEVEELWPEFVTHDTEGRTAGMIYDRMISVLIKEMQAMKAEIKALKEKVA
jgi:hypothetical protein